MRYLFSPYLGLWDRETLTNHSNTSTIATQFELSYDGIQSYTKTTRSLYYTPPCMYFCGILQGVPESCSVFEGLYLGYPKGKKSKTGGILKRLKRRYFEIFNKCYHFPPFSFNFSITKARHILRIKSIYVWLLFPIFFSLHTLYISCLSLSLFWYLSLETWQNAIIRAISNEYPHYTLLLFFLFFFFCVCLGVGMSVILWSGWEGEREREKKKREIEKERERGYNVASTSLPYPMRKAHSR
jgi:hypothetical protein